ncbi:MAG: hypothetical protein IT204_21150 [Fimbriimonadaceae bacterium]|nr:hypothetical protein [Fimbriimonadaceae bacterium]
MPDHLSALRELFAGTALREAYNAVLAARGLAGLSATPILSSRRELRGAGRWPALACELGSVASQREGAGGLRSLRGEATWWLALAAPADETLAARAAAYLDSLREALEATLPAALQRFECSALELGGEPLREVGLAAHLYSLRGRYCWLYQAAGA